METEQESRLAKQTGGGGTSDGQARADSRGQDSLALGQGYDKLGPEKMQLQGPYFLRSRFRNMKSSSTSKTFEGSSPKTNIPQTFKKNYGEPKESFEDSKELNEPDHLLGLKSFTDQTVPFRAELPIPKKSLCRNCTKIFDKYSSEADFCPGCLMRTANGEFFDEANREHQARLDICKEAALVRDCHGGTVSTTDHDANLNKDCPSASRLEKNNRVKPLVNVIKHTQTSALMKNMDHIRKSKVLCSTEQSINTIKNLPGSSFSNIKINFGISTGEKKATAGTLAQSNISPKTQSRTKTLMNNDRISPEALNSQQKPDSKKTLRTLLNQEHSADPVTQSQALNILSKKPSASLVNNPIRITAYQSGKPLRNSSRREPAKGCGNDGRSRSSSGKSDEELSVIFGFDRSLTKTIKANSVHASESIETDPEVELSMRKEENRTLSFLNEDEDEIMDKVPEQPRTTLLHKKKLKPTSDKFQVNKKYSICDEKGTPENPLLDVIHTPYPYLSQSMFANMSNSFGGQSMYSTGDSRLQNQNKSDIIDQIRHSSDPINDSKPSSVSINYQPLAPPYSTVGPFSGYTAGMGPRFMREKVTGVPAELPLHQFSQVSESYSLQQYDITQNLSMMSGPSAEDDAQKKNRARKSQPVTDTKEFGINVDRIFDLRKTTLMIKNIPNRYTKDMMLETIDKKFKEKFNFFYLPIDFDNKCNVGYAFINFIDLADIKDFYLEFNGSTWPNFKSDKICEITYARIQGKEACIHHFKDSSLMKQEVS